MIDTNIIVGNELFNVGDQYDWLAQNNEDGAVVMFTGKVRNYNQGDSVKMLTLEHYPGMTEKILSKIIVEARNRWLLQKISIIHRIGTLFPGDKIVFVGVSSIHRSAAFNATEFIMDHLKTQAPFWKKEIIGDDGRWVEAIDKDHRAIEHWYE